MTGVFECTALLDVFLPIKVKKCKEQLAQSAQSYESFCIRAGRGALGATAIFIFQSSTQKPTLPGS